MGFLFEIRLFPFAVACVISWRWHSLSNWVSPDVSDIYRVNFYFPYKALCASAPSVLLGLKVLKSFQKLLRKLWMCQQHQTTLTQKWKRRHSVLNQMRSNTIGNVNSGNQNDMFHHGSGCMNFCNLRTKDAHVQLYLQKKKQNKK